MDVLIGIGAFWLSTWIMLMYRTFAIIRRLVDTYEIALVQKYKLLHMLILSIMYLLCAPFLIQVVFSDKYRKSFIIKYVDALCKKLEGEIAVAHANIKTYERNSIGIGEHPELVQAIETQVEIIAHAEDKLNVIRNHFG